ncbi:MAG: hypothetical protein HY922_03010 [Elusimicrobia bacterium]|nr:hypothetical protein [Elusimicrobiota bacterium]
MNSDDLQRELDRLWEKVTSGMPAPVEPSGPFPSPAGSGDLPSITREAERDAMSLLKGRHLEQLDDLRRLAESKDATIRELRERLSCVERDLTSLRRRSKREETVVYQQALELSARLEQAQGVLQAQAGRFAEEDRALRGLLEQARGQLAAETGRWRELERQWNEREQQYLLDMQELRSLAERAQQDAGRHEDRSRKGEAQLKEAKTAIEKTLAELLQERHEHKSARKELAEAFGKIKEGEDRLMQLQNIWEEERKQWQELWDRERSTWETQRQEISSWEEKLRRERETWHGGLQAMEAKETHYAERMAEILQKSSEAGEKVAGLLRAASERPAPAVAVTEVRPPRPWRKIASALTLALALAGSAPLYRYWQRLRLDFVSEAPVALSNPTGMAYDGSLLWACDWRGELVSLDPQDPSRVLERMRASPGGKYHPVALALSGDALYSLDSAQSRIARHTIGRPSEIKAVWPTPGPAPAALAHDGKNLWSYDAVTRTFYRHLSEGPDGVCEDYRSELDLVPGAMTWHNGELWVYDSKGKRVIVFGVRGHSLEPVKAAGFAAAAQSLALALAPSQGGRPRLELWALAPAGAQSPAATLRRYRVRR